jgi:integrase
MGHSVKSIPDDKLESFGAHLRAVHFKFYVLLRLGLETGLRVSDLLRLRTAQISACMRVLESKTKKTKECRLTDELLALISDYITEHQLTGRDALFFSAPHAKHKSLSRVRVYQVFKAAAYALDMVSIGPHSMRKSFAKKVWRETKSVRAVKDALGHKYLDTTLHYLMDFTNLESLLE